MRNLRLFFFFNFSFFSDKAKTQIIELKLICAFLYANHLIINDTIKVNKVIAALVLLLDTCACVTYTTSEISNFVISNVIQRRSYFYFFIFFFVNSQSPVKNTIFDTMENEIYKM